MCKYKRTVLVLLIATLLLTLTISCNPTSELSPTNNDQLEQGSDAESIDTIQPKITMSLMEKFETELQDIQLAVTAIMADSGKMTLDNSYTRINNLDLVTTDSGTFRASDYFLGTIIDGKLQSGCVYDIYEDGTVIQIRPDATVITPTPVTSAIPTKTFSVDEDYDTELHNVQTAVLAAMADAGVGVVAGGCESGSGIENFGNTGHTTTPPYTGTDCEVTDSVYVGDYIINGAADIACSYTIATDGKVTQVWTP